MKLCTVCGVVTSRAGSRCTEHARQSNRSRHNALYSTGAWQRLSARVLRAWRGEHGNWCPGYGRDAHPAADLTADHVVPLAAGGAPFDPANVAVLCRSCNSTKGASRADRGYPHAGSALVRTEQSRFAERHGLVSTGQEYTDLVSGKDTLRRSDFARMVRDAESGAFEVLLVYDTSRFARNIEDAYSYRRRLAAAGVTVVFCADSLIAGNVDTYELEGLKTVADAAYIRRLSLNVGRGYEQKWCLFNDPGGHAPLGFARTGDRQLLEPVEGPDLDLVRRAFELYAAGTWSDTTLADELGLTEAGLAEILVNPLYAGRAIRHKGRPDEEERPARFAAPMDPGLFDRVQAVRTSGGPGTRE